MTPLKTSATMSDKVRHRVTEYLGLQGDEELRFLYDNSMFGSAASGVAITSGRIASYDKADVTWIAYPTIISVRVESDATGTTHTLTVAGPATTMISRVLYLVPADLTTFLDAIRAQVRPEIVHHDMPASHVEAAGWVGPFAVADHPVICAHCHGEQFTLRELMLNTRGMTFFKLDWLDGTANGLECVTCGLVALFTRAPTRR